MADGKIGYNIGQANEVMSNIQTKFKELEGKIYQNWPAVETTLQKEWSGEDEQDFETKFAETICSLYTKAGAIAQYAINIIENVTTEWYNFQKKNTLSGGESAGNAGGLFGIGGNKFNLEVPKISPSEKIISAKLVQLTNDSFRGLINGATSATNIKTKVDEFVNQTKKDTNDLFNEIETSSAFYGSQTTALKSLIEKAGTAIGDVTIAVKDLYDALDKLAATNYSASDENVGTAISGDAITKMEQAVEESVGNSRWI